MCFAKLTRIAALLALAALGGCNTDNLMPSGDDKRPAVTPGSTGYLPGQLAADFTLPDIGGGSFKLSEHLTGGATPADAVVVYFTMWCPTCLGHTDHMVYAVMPQFAGRGTVRYVMVDYVSGTIAYTRSSAQANGYVGSGFTVVGDSSRRVFDQLNAAMGTTIVIHPNGEILMNEDYRGGANLISTLDALLP